MQVPKVFSSLLPLLQVLGLLSSPHHICTRASPLQFEFLGSLSRAFNLIFTKIRTLIIVMSLVYIITNLITKEIQLAQLYHRETQLAGYRQTPCFCEKFLAVSDGSQWSSQHAVGISYYSFTAETKCSILGKKLMLRTSVCFRVNKDWLVSKGFIQFIFLIFIY